MIIDDESAMGGILVKSLALDGIEGIAFTDANEALAAIPREHPDLVLTDVRMPEMTGPEVLARIKSDHPGIPVLIMTAYGRVEDAVDSLKAGAFNYITKPFQHDYLVHQIELALEQRKLSQQVDSLSGEAVPVHDAREIIGSSAGLERVRTMIQRAAETDSAVLITGESGVGKELVARQVHELSARRRKRFIAVNCPAIPTALIESEMFGYEQGAFTGADPREDGPHRTLGRRHAFPR